MIKIPVRFVLMACSLLPLLLQAQIVVQIDRDVKLTFPGQPDKLDTLGQRVYIFSDENAYYSCIVQKTNIDPIKLVSIDLGQFYSEIYQSVQNPADKCQSISQNEIVILNTRAMEFYAQCEERPDIPELRYKRLVLNPPNLYVIDFWTTRAMYNQSGSLKKVFFESMTIDPQNDQATIPSALDNTDPADPSRIRYGYFLAAIAILLAVLLYLRKKPKK